MISVNASDSLNPSRTTYFTAFEPCSFDDLAHVITKRIWSPIVWKDNLRRNANFYTCEYVVLDFDSGEETLASMDEFCKEAGIWYLIGTTKSHQKEKKSPSGKISPPCDRFRLIMRMNEVCSERERYVYAMKQYARWFSCDSSCVDGARFFYPCIDIYAYSKGKKQTWPEFDEEYVPEDQRHEVYSAKLRHMGKLGLMPPWLEHILLGKSIILEGNRHKTCYRMGAMWASLGFPLKTLLERAEKTSLANIGQSDLIRAITNGFIASQEQHYG